MALETQNFSLTDVFCLKSFIYDSTKAVRTIVHNAKCAYYSAKIAKMNFQNCSQIFSVTRFKQLEINHLDKPLSEVDQDNQFSGCPFNSFTPISENSLRKIILQCASKTWN